MSAVLSHYLVPEESGKDQSWHVIGGSGLVVGASLLYAGASDPLARWLEPFLMVRVQFADPRFDRLQFATQHHFQPCIVPWLAAFLSTRAPVCFCKIHLTPYLYDISLVMPDIKGGTRSQWRDKAHRQGIKVHMPRLFVSST